jgi:hypothetical protein
MMVPFEFYPDPADRAVEREQDLNSEVGDEGAVHSAKVRSAMYSVDCRSTL